MKELLDEIIAEGWDISFQYLHSAGVWSCSLARPHWWTSNPYGSVVLPSACHEDPRTAIELTLRLAQEEREMGYKWEPSKPVPNDKWEAQSVIKETMNCPECSRPINIERRQSARHLSITCPHCGATVLASFDRRRAEWRVFSRPGSKS